ncbi:MAG: hypothetical protein WB763_05350 [Terriglobia bacterium]|jgi:hypothetical protein
MYTGGAYITYSELFDRRPTWEEIVAKLQNLSPLQTVLMMSRINTHIRHAFEEPGRKSVGWLQGFLVRNFVDDAALARLRERFPTTRMEDRPLFHPLQVLNVLRIALAVCAGDDESRPDQREDLRYQLGTACLMMNDLLVSKEEDLLIQTGTDEERQLQLMAHLVAPLELLNPAPARHLMFRSHVLFRILLRDQAVRDDIEKKCRGFDIEDRFQQIAGIPLSKWLTLVFAAYSYYMARRVEELVEQPQFFVINRQFFISTSGVSQREMDDFISTIAMPFESLQRTLGAERPADPRFDLVPFRSRPLYELEEGNFACIDTAFLLEKMVTGVHWLIHDGLSRSARDDLFTAWGRLFERYVDWLFEGMRTQSDTSFFSFPKWADGKESFDGAFLKGTVLVPMEYKGGFLSQEAKYSGKVVPLVKDLTRKILPGCEQLSSKIARLFNPDPIRQMRIPDIPARHVTRVLPVLVVQDHGLRGLFLNWWLNKEFIRMMRSHTLRTEIEVLPLNVVNIQELETLVDSVESASFDFIYALHHKAVRDPEMVDDLQNFLLGFPGYGVRRSKRSLSVLKEIKKEMFSYLFPGQVAPNDDDNVEEE